MHQDENTVGPAWTVRQQGNLFWQLTRKEMNLAYSKRLLGALWYVLSPAALIAMYYIAFTQVLGVKPVENYALFLSLGIIHWQFFSVCVKRATRSITSNGSILATSRFPRHLLPLASSAGQFLMLGYAVALMAVIFIPLGGSLWWGTILYLPLVFLAAVMMGGIALFISAATVFVRDLTEIANIAMRVGMFISPVLYRFQRLDPRLQEILAALPFAPPINAIRDVTFYHRVPSLETLALFVGWTVLFGVLGTWFFRRTQARFLEHL